MGNILGMNAPPSHCAPLSLLHDAPLYGTATAAATWFLLEYNAPWTAKATDDNQLPLSVNHWLQSLVAQNSHSRVQFIRQPISPTPGQITFYAATAGHLYRHQVTDYADLLQMDLAALCDLACRVDEQVYLVCTNGKRDYCCGKWGAAAYRLLDSYLKQEPHSTLCEQVWMSTHLGGHRFAPTLLVLPVGMMYGLVQPNEIPAWLQAQRGQELYLSRYRGRSQYPPTVQAAEYFLYQAAKETHWQAFHYRESDAAAGSHQFYHSATGTFYTVNVAEHPPPQSTLVSCSPPKWANEPVYQLSQITHKVTG